MFGAIGCLPVIFTLITPSRNESFDDYIHCQDKHGIQPTTHRTQAVVVMHVITQARMLIINVPKYFEAHSRRPSTLVRTASDAYTRGIGLKVSNFKRLLGDIYAYYGALD